MRVLIVEDEARLAEFIRKGLKEAGYAADIAEDASNGEYLVSINNYDMILLDWLIPGITGLELCREWRKRGLQTPVIMLTVKDNTNDIIEALDSGADDYIIKPFSFEELLARIRAHQRRSAVMPENTLLKLDDLVVDVVRREVHRGGIKLILTGREFALLEFLLRSNGKVLSRSTIAKHVWGMSLENSNLVEVYVNHLRRKLDCGSRLPLIHTVRGFGYVMKVLNS